MEDRDKYRKSIDGRRKWTAAEHNEQKNNTVTRRFRKQDRKRGEARKRLRMKGRDEKGKTDSSGTYQIDK